MAAQLLPGPRGELEVLSVGSGEPSTIFAHGLGSSIPATRPYASGVAGRRTFFHFSSHGRSDAAESGWNYGVLADELQTVADAVSARQAVGVSMGAGAIVRTLLRDPARFDRAVLILPATVDDVRDSSGLLRYQELADASEHGDTTRLRRALTSELPAAAVGSEAGEAWLDQQTEAFARPGMAAALRQLPHAVPVPAIEELSRVQVPVLILAQEGDAVHPVAAAQRLAQAIPSAHLEVFDEHGLLFAHRDAVRTLISSFLRCAQRRRIDEVLTRRPAVDDVKWKAAT